MTQYIPPTQLPEHHEAPPHGKAKSHLGWIIALGVVAVVWAAAFAIRGDGAGSGNIMPGWADGMEAGQRLAQEHDRPMVVAFTAEW